MGRFYTKRLTFITIFLYDSEKRYTKEGDPMDGYGLASLLPQRFLCWQERWLVL